MRGNSRLNALEKFRIDGLIAIITGGAGLLGGKHAEAVLEAGGIPVLLDISQDCLSKAKEKLLAEHKQGVVETFCVSITNKEALIDVSKKLLEKYGHIDILINNAANNPKVEGSVDNMKNIQFENFPLSIWNDDVLVGLTGAFLCSQIFGSAMAEKGSGVILNISSDLGIIAPDQRIYRKEGIPDTEQTVKPVTYSVIKHGLLGLTKYLATYWAEKGVRTNAVCPGGVYNGQDQAFMDKLTNLIPLGRMADTDEYKSTILYMVSSASSYMNGSTVIIDGGRTCW